MKGSGERAKLWIKDIESAAEVEKRKFQQVCAEVVPLVLVSALVWLRSMTEKRETKTIELNDGTRMPLLGLGTWKVGQLQFH